MAKIDYINSILSKTPYIKSSVKYTMLEADLQKLETDTLLILHQAIIEPAVKAEYQFDHFGHQRIKIRDNISWPALYDSIVFLNHAGSWYAAFSQYYEGSAPHDMCEKVFKLVPVETKGHKLGEEPMHNFFQQKKEEG